MASKFELNDLTPSAPSGRVNVKWQSDINGNVSAHIATPSAASQTPWNQNIDAAGFNLTSVGNLGVGKASPSYPLDVLGDVNISGSYRVNGVPLAIGGGSQTPWTSDIDGNTKRLTNVAELIIGTATDAGTYALQVTGDSFLTGKLLFSPDNTYDIGASGATRPRNVYVALAITAGSSITSNTSMNAAQYIKTDVASNMVTVTHAGGTLNGVYGLYWEKTTEQLQVYAAGSSRWAITGAGHILASTDNSYDIGASAATRPRNIHVASSIYHNAATTTAADSPAPGAIFGGTRPTILFDQGSTARSRITVPAANPRIELYCNGYWDGTNIMCDDVAQPLSNMQMTTSLLSLVYVPAGANPRTASYVTPFKFDLVNNQQTIAGTRPTILFDYTGTGNTRARIQEAISAPYLYIEANCSYSGTWNRDDTAQASSHIRIAPSDFQLYYVAAGTGTITWGSPLFSVDFTTGGNITIPAGKSISNGQAWTTLTLQNSWANASGTARYRLNVNGDVDVIGILSGGTTTGGTVIANLPAGFRPTNQQDFLAWNGGTTVCRITVDSSGNMVLQNAATAVCEFAITIKMG